MKAVLQCWLYNKRAFARLILSGILFILYRFSCIRIVVIINNAMSRPDNISNEIWIAIGCCICMFLTGRLYLLYRKFALYDCYVASCNRLADKVLDSDVDMFIDHSCAYISTIQSAITELCGAGWGTVEMVVNIASIAFVLESIFEIAGWIVLPVIGIYIGIFILTRIIYPKYGNIGKNIARITKYRNQEIENIIYGFMEVRSFCTQQKHRESVRRYNKERNEWSHKKTWLTIALSGGISIIDNTALIVALLLSAGLITAGKMTETDGVTVALLVIRIVDPLMNVLDFMDEFSEMTKHGVDFVEIMNYREPIQSGLLEITGFKESIQLQNVSFAYDGTSSVLETISMEIKKGEKIGICGESGGGKTTLFKLINKLYKPQTGQISIDGIDIWSIANESYRKIIGSVHQENTMFPGTILMNITYGSNNVVESQIIDACKKAHIYDFIMSLPEGFETEIGPRGLVLSTGQKQRIALARLLLVDPPIILLDEATSALDNESESAIQDAIDGLKDKTIITIAHRLSTIWNSDQIYVIGDHGILEHGTHDELMSLEGVYYKMNKKKGDIIPK